MLDITDSTLIDDAIEKADANDPIEPMDRNDPTLPIDSVEPTEPIDRNESLDEIDHVPRRDVPMAVSSRHARLHRPGGGASVVGWSAHATVPTAGSSRRSPPGGSLGPEHARSVPRQPSAGSFGPLADAAVRRHRQMFAPRPTGSSDRSPGTR
jgi:hypothetical protein